MIVASSRQLSCALNNAMPGNHIVLENGSYSGFTVSRSGQEGNPIVIRAVDTLAAKVSGRIILRGNDLYVVGVDVTQGNVVIEANRNRISRSRLRSREAQYSSKIPHNRPSLITTRSTRRRSPRLRLGSAFESMLQGPASITASTETTFTVHRNGRRAMIIPQSSLAPASTA